jgi:predicted DNA-binding WGR domain protein
VYIVEVLPKGSGYVVNFAYGRRGAALKAGTKTPRPVTRGEAEKLYEKLVSEKRAKGYAEGNASEVKATTPARVPASAKPAAAAAKPAHSSGSGLSEALREFERKAGYCLRAYRAGATDLSLLLHARLDGKRDVKLEWYRTVDPALGALTFDGLWWRARPRSVPGFGDAVNITFDVPNAFERLKSKDRFPPPPRPPTAGQRKALHTFLADPQRYRRIVEEANWPFYQQNLQDADEEGYPADVLHLHHPSDVWTLLDKPRITIPVQTGPAWWIEFTWDCRWDPEHGHKVVLRNGKPNYVGQQGGG